MVSRCSGDFYLARKYYDQARRNLARSYDAFSRFIKLRLAEAAKAIDVRLRHRGKHLVPPGAEHRKRRLRHGHPSTISRCPLTGHSDFNVAVQSGNLNLEIWSSGGYRLKKSATTNAAFELMPTGKGETEESFLACASGRRPPARQRFRQGRC